MAEDFQTFFLKPCWVGKSQIAKFSQHKKAGTLIFFFWHSSPYPLIYHHAWEKLFSFLFAKPNFFIWDFLFCLGFSKLSVTQPETHSKSRKTLSFSIRWCPQYTILHVLCESRALYSYNAPKSGKKGQNHIKIIWVPCVP